jgi:glucose/arabinose dehydrogenase
VNGEKLANVARLRASEDGLRMIGREPLLVLDAKQTASHQISNITIGPDRKLYVHFGDGLWDPSARDLTMFRGKILRVNMDGTAPSDNPFYDEADGISARDYVFASGFRNPFGGAWRAADHSLYEIENGPETDRLARVVRGRDYGWDRTDASMSNYAISSWSAPAAPVQMAWVQPETFDGSGFPRDKMDTAYVTESGPTWASGGQAVDKRVSEVKMAGEEVVGRPLPFVVYDGTGKGTAAAIAAGPDGLYFSDLYKDFDFQSPVDRGANVYRVRWAGWAAFEVRMFTPDGLGLRFTDRSNVPAAETWRWDFGDGEQGTGESVEHHYAEPGTYIVRLRVNGAVETAKRVVVRGNRLMLDERFSR